MVLQFLKSKLPACQGVCQIWDTNSAVIDLQYWSAVTDLSIRSLHLVRYAYLTLSTPQPVMKDSHESMSYKGHRMQITV